MVRIVTEIHTEACLERKVQEGLVEVLEDIIERNIEGIQIRNRKNSPEMGQNT